MYNEMEVGKAYYICLHTSDYRFKVFYSGEYEFLSCMYWLSGKNI